MKALNVRTGRGVSNVVLGQPLTLAAPWFPSPTFPACAGRATGTLGSRPATGPGSPVLFLLLPAHAAPSPASQGLHLTQGLCKAAASPFPEPVTRLPSMQRPLERVPKHHHHLFLQSTLSQKMKFEKFSQGGLSLETTTLLESFRVTQELGL